VIIGPLLDNAITLLSDVATARLRNERLDAGIAWTAHELRSPLVGLRALLDLEAMSPQAAEDLSDLRATARRDLAALLQQVEDLLQWALGGDRLPTQAADLVQLIREAVTASLPEESTGRVVLDGPPALQVAAEPAELRRAITNVIQNALTHSPRDVPVRVSMRSSGGIVTIKVADRGHGVSSTEARALFDPLARGEETQGPRSAHGLGLFIARRIVEAQGGSIRVDPRAPGTTFIIELPARSPDPSAA
jgi:signal transduction histidine kinase